MSDEPNQTHRLYHLFSWLLIWIFGGTMNLQKHIQANVEEFPFCNCTRVCIGHEDQKEKFIQSQKDLVREVVKGAKKEVRGLYENTQPTGTQSKVDVVNNKLDQVMAKLLKLEEGI